MDAGQRSTAGDQRKSKLTTKGNEGIVDERGEKRLTARLLVFWLACCSLVSSTVPGKLSHDEFAFMLSMQILMSVEDDGLVLSALDTQRIEKFVSAVAGRWPPVAGRWCQTRLTT